MTYKEEETQSEVTEAVSKGLNTHPSPSAFWKLKEKLSMSSGGMKGKKENRSHVQG